MSVELILVIMALLITGVNVFFTFGCMLAIGAIAREFEVHKKGVLGLAGAADEAFKNDRLRLSQIEKFIVFAFKLDEIFGIKKPADTDLKEQVAPKKDDLKN